MKNKHLIITGLIAAAAHTAALANEPAIQTIKKSELPFVETPEGVAFALLMGERFEGEYLAMVKLPAGLVSPPHKKSATMFGVMLAGEMTHGPLEANPASLSVLGPGSYYRIPAGLAHASRCVSEVDCITVLYQDGAFDFLPAE